MTAGKSWKWLIVLQMLVVQVAVSAQEAVPPHPDSNNPNIVILADSKDWRLSWRRSYRLGKILSYRLNAYDDYAISQLILDYVETGDLPIRKDRVGQRAFDYIADATTRYDRPEAMERVVVRAYTLRWLNGYADLMWARFMEKAYLIRPRIIGRHYGDKESGRIDLFFWTFILQGDIEPIARFASSHLPFALPPEIISEEILHVQHNNSIANLRSASELLGDGIESSSLNLKVSLLHDIAQVSRRPRSFLRGAARGQLGAGRWDSIFSRLIRRNFL